MKFLLPYDGTLSHPINTIMEMPIDSSYAMGRVLHSGNITSWEREVFAALLALVSSRKPCGFLDMGANIGFYSVAIKLLFPQIRITAIEANSKLVKKIEEMSNLNNVNINVINAALTGSGEERVTFYLADSDDCSSCEALKNSIAEIVVNAISLDSIQDDHEIWKMDTEGTEPDILEPQADLINRSRPFLVIEILNVERFLKIRNIFLPLNYSIYHLGRNYQIVETFDYESKGGWNYLFAPSPLSAEFHADHQRWRTAIDATGAFQINHSLATEAAVYDFVPMEYLRKSLNLGEEYKFYPLTSPKWLAFYPSQLRKDIHYEFIINNGKIHICLHFETPDRDENIKHRNIIYQKLFKNGIFLSFPVKKNEYMNIFSIEFGLIYNPTLPALDLYAQLMNEFTKYTREAVGSLLIN